MPRDLIGWRSAPALCADGKIRTVRVKSVWDGARWVYLADTFFSVPARVCANGKTVAGFVEGREGEPNLEFHAYLYRRNAFAITRKES